VSTMRTRKKPVEPGEVALVGGGTGPADLITARGLTLLDGAHVVVSDGPPDPTVAARLAPGVETVDATGKTPAEAARLVVAAARRGCRVVRLLPGDPFSSPAGAEEAEALVRAKLPFDVVPGVPVALAAATFAGVPAASRKHASFAIASGVDETAETAATTLCVVPSGLVGKLAARLVEAGRPGDTPLALTWSGGTPEQVTIVTTLDGAESDALRGPSDKPAVAIVGDAVRLRDRLSWFEQKPLFGWRVLVPRTKEQAGSLSDALREFGAVPVEVPTIAVEAPRSPAPMDRAIKGLVSGRYQWTAFTSVNAVRAVREKFEALGLDARAFAGVKVAAVGESTEAALLAWGIRPELTPSADQSSEGLLADWPPYDDVFDPIDRVFLPRADIATETLVAGLKERGWVVDDVTAYRTVRAAPPPAEVRDAIKGGGFDAVLFTSSSTVRNLVGIAGKPHPSTVVACIGPATCRTATEAGLRVDVQAAEPSVPALVDALAGFAVDRRAEGLPPRPAARAPKPAKSRTWTAGR
jgi:uroporphyrinogen III methyltransferase / synthase